MSDATVDARALAAQVTTARLARARHAGCRPRGGARRSASHARYRRRARSPSARCAASIATRPSCAAAHPAAEVPRAARARAPVGGAVRARGCAHARLCRGRCGREHREGRRAAPRGSSMRCCAAICASASRWRPKSRAVPAARHAAPVWLAERLREDWPERWTHFLAACDAQAPMWLRVNARHATAEDYVATAARGGNRGGRRAARAAGRAAEHAVRRRRAAGIRGRLGVGAGSRRAMRRISLGPRAGPAGARRLRGSRRKDRAHRGARARARAAGRGRHRSQAPRARAREPGARRARRPSSCTAMRRPRGAGGTACRSTAFCSTHPARRSASSAAIPTSACAAPRRISPSCRALQTAPARRRVRHARARGPPGVCHLHADTKREWRSDPGVSRAHRRCGRRAGRGVGRDGRVSARPTRSAGRSSPVRRVPTASIMLP